MNTKPEALRLAELLDTDGWPDAAAELIRLHEENQALRQALAQPEKPPVKSYCGGKPNYCTPEVTPEVTGKVLAQPEQEPEWIEDGYGTAWKTCGKKDCGKFVVKPGKVDCWNGDCLEGINRG